MGQIYQEPKKVTKFTLLVKEENTDTWTEDMEVSEGWKGSVEEYARALVEWFNSTRHGEPKRIYVGINNVREEIIIPDEADEQEQFER